MFLKPLKETNPLYNEKEKLIGVVKYTDGSFKEGDLVGFRSLGQYEFIIDNERLYRVKSNFITILDTLGFVPAEVKSFLTSNISSRPVLLLPL